MTEVHTKHKNKTKGIELMFCFGVSVEKPMAVNWTARGLFFQEHLLSVLMCTQEVRADTQTSALADDQWPEQRWQKP